jgi:hypothetical protein
LFSTQASAGALTHTINGNNIFCKAGFSINGGSSSSASLTTGTTVINITGTGTISTSSTVSGGLGNSLTFNASGSTITLPGNLYYRTGTLKYVAGTLSGACNVVPTASFTADMNNGGLNYTTPFSIPNTTLSITITMLSDWYLSGITNVGAGVLTINGSSFYCTGTISSNSGGSITGTSVLRLKGSGAGQSFTSTSPIAVDISIEAGSNTVNLGNTIYTPRSGGSTITYTSGTINHSGTLTINGPNALTMSTSGMNFNNISVTTATMSITLNSLLSATGTLSILAGIGVTFLGISGFTVGTLSRTDSPVAALSLTVGNTYTVTSNLTWYYNTIGAFAQIKSNSAGSQVVFTLRKGATQLVGNASFTDLDSSAGQTIYAWRPGSISNCLNIQALTPSLMQRSATYVN